MYIKRHVEQTILEAAQSFPCIVIYGPRQVGKSTTINFLFGDSVPMVTLDDTDDRNLALNNPRLFLERYGWPLIIDEIQKAPNLLDEIKIKIDEQRLKWLKSNEQRQLMYILTGSNRFELQEGISDSLAGRCGVIEMLSLSQAEKYSLSTQLFSPDINRLTDLERNLKEYYRPRSAIFQDIFNGGMPDVFTGISKREIYFKAYVDTYIEKDVKKLIAAASEMQFRNFISIVALRTSQELHYDEIARSVGIDVRTCKKWISILETSGVVYLLQPYMANISNRIIKAPKLYFTDTGLCSYLCKWPNAEMLENCAMSGAFFETYVVGEMVKNFYAHGQTPKDFLFYYRDIDQKEIDLLLVDGQSICPIEIKKGITPKKASKNFNVLGKYNMEIKNGLVIDCCDKIRPINASSYYIPVYLL
ncbi:MAG: ATP-binding protein [Phascolarctobacterium sp.]|uniref:ATP-binding protein n=1 Tax=Phascolarctobacterium sp. TaxID=2049039 RepID=UPI0026DAD998|nr:ATP-binding protein [Phascolarctobacterium sp.]MDO4922326.1 ATP-binding protein [Phascolarctobacterium sp.]